MTTHTVRHTRPRRVFWLGVALLLLAALAVRLHRLDAVALRGDEGYTAVLWTAMPFSTDWWELARAEPAPIGAFTVWWAWTGLVGSSVFALRILSVLGNLAGLAVMLALTRRLTGRWSVAGLVGLLWAVNPFLIWHAQDARIYGLQSVLTPLSFYWLWRATSGRSQGMRAWWPYLAVQMVAIYLYYFEPLWLVAQGVYVLALRRRAVWRQATRAWLLLGVLCAPVALQLYWLMAVSRYQGNAQTAELVTYFSEFLPTYLLGQDTTAPPLLGLIVLGAVIAGLVWGFDPRQTRQRVLLLAWLLIPALLLALLSWRAAFFRPRYIMMTIPPLLMGIVLAATAIPARLTGHWRLGLVSGGLVVALLSAAGGLETYRYFYSDPPKAPDWPALTAYLEARTLPQDVVLTGEPDPALLYYYDRPADVYFIPVRDFDGDYKREVARLRADYDGFYLLSSARSADLEAVLRQDLQAIPGDTFPGVQHFREWTVSPQEIQHPLDVRFDDVAVLRGYTLLSGGRGGAVLLLYWEPLRQTTAPHSILTHVVPATQPDNPPVAVLDHGPANAVVATTHWQPGTLYRDPVALPPDIPPGDYLVRIGLYETGTLVAVPLADTAQQTQHAGRYPALTFSAWPE